MNKNKQRAEEILKITGLKPTNFADLVRVAQIIDHPRGCIFSQKIEVNWLDFDIPQEVADNLRRLGFKYRYESPHVEIEVVWEQLTPATRSWFIANKKILWQIEEAFPALDED